ncbi:hypothetical protein BBJ28_00026900 [Nothophytophthora sp. Chile5]|nr:hypothetical protein BBJ28_00026900 [Nothophytophthora sp. Chile5]
MIARSENAVRADMLEARVAELEARVVATLTPQPPTTPEAEEESPPPSLTESTRLASIENFQWIQFQLQNAYDIPVESRGNFRLVRDAIGLNPSPGQQVLQSPEPRREFLDRSKASQRSLDILALEAVDGMTAEQKLKTLDEGEQMHDLLVEYYGTARDTGSLIQAILRDDAIAKAVLHTEYPLSHYLVKKRARNALAHPKLMAKLNMARNTET